MQDMYDTEVCSSLVVSVQTANREVWGSNSGQGRKSGTSSMLPYSYFLNYPKKFSIIMRYVHPLPHSDLMLLDY